MNISPFHTLAQVGADGRTLLLPGAHEVQGGPSQEGRPPQEQGQFPQQEGHRLPRAA